MSTLKNMMAGEKRFRWKLLTGTSLAVFLGATQAIASDSERPAVWLEFGAQFERRSGEDAPFLPMFTRALTNEGLLSPLEVQQPPKYSFGGEGSLSYRPEGSDWTFSGSILFGRSNGDKHRYQTKSVSKVPVPFIPGKYHTRPLITADFSVRYKESHAIVDFNAGKDVGLGLFGRSGTSSVGFGVRIAQFSAKEHLTGNGIPPESDTFYTPPAFPFYRVFDMYTVSSQADRNFRGIGPSVRWSGSAPVAGAADSEELAVDWDVHAAALFGRQRAQLHQVTTDRHQFNHYVQKYDNTYTFTGGVNRARSVIVPDIGASVAFSLKFPNAKITIGYRADEFLNAMDTGVDTRKASNVLFHGPFASISIGVSPFDL